MLYRTSTNTLHSRKLFFPILKRKTFAHIFILEKWSINYKTIDGGLKWPANVSNKNEIMPAVFGQTFLFVSPISWHPPQVTKNCLFCVWIWFFWGRKVLLKIYRNISCVKSCLSFNCWAYLDLHRQTTQTIEEANSRTLLATKS